MLFDFLGDEEAAAAECAPQVRGPPPGRPQDAEALCTGRIGT